MVVQEVAQKGVCQVLCRTLGLTISVVLVCIHNLSTELMRVIPSLKASKLSFSIKVNPSTTLTASLEPNSTRRYSSHAQLDAQKACGG